MKVYVAKYFESLKGISLEGIRYKKENDKYVGLYCSYFLRAGKYDIASLVKNITEMKPVLIEYNENDKCYESKI